MQFGGPNTGNPLDILSQMGLFGNAGASASSLFNDPQAPVFTEKAAANYNIEDLKKDANLDFLPSSLNKFIPKQYRKQIDKYINAKNEILNRSVNEYNNQLPMARLLPSLFDLQMKGMDSTEKSNKLSINDIQVTKGSSAPYGYAQSGGVVNNTGYLNGSPTEGNKFNIIPSNNITMRGVKYPVLAITNRGESKLMMPNEDYKFEGAEYVTEIPMKGLKADKLKNITKTLF